MSLADQILGKSGFCRIADALRNSIESLVTDDFSATEPCSSVFNEYFRSPDSPQPNEFYAPTYLTFSHRYMLINVAKNYHLLDTLSELGLLASCRTILDLGSGPGSFALSLLTWLDEQDGNAMPSVEIQMVDAVEEFVQLFERVWQLVDLDKKRDITVRATASFVDGSFLQFADKPDMILFSNSLTEILRNSRVRQDQFMTSLIESEAVIAIVDYEYAELSHLLEEFASCLETRFPGEWWSHSQSYEPVHLGRLSPMDTPEFGQMIRDERHVEYVRSIWIPHSRKRELRGSSGREV